MTKPAYKAVFVSPHLDDAVFSCGGEIARLVKEGPVLVLNVFTRYPETMKSHAMVLGAERYQEERAASDFLGFASRNLDELDAPFRHPAYRSPGKLFAPPLSEDFTYLPALRERLFGFLDGLDYQTLYVPLAIGWHVDHLLTHLVFEPWATRANVIYYEDAPYCLIQHATKYRLQELGRYQGAAGDRSLAPAGWASEAWQAAMAYADTALMRNLKPWIVRSCAVPVVSIYLFRLMAYHRRLAAASHPRFSLAPRVAPMSDGFMHKLQAMALYTSQFREFFAGMDDCAASYAAYSRRITARDGQVERYWTLASAA